MKEISPKKAPRTHKDEVPSAKLLMNVFGKMHPSDLSPMHVAKYLDMRGKVAPVRANREKIPLSHMSSIAMRWGIVDTNPCCGVERNTETPRNRFVTDDELNNFCKYAEGQGEIGRMLSAVASCVFDWSTARRFAEIAP